MSHQTSPDANDDMLPEYDFSRGLRGKHYQAFRAGTNVVFLDPDVATAFADSVSVNQALRLLVKLARSDFSRGGPIPGCSGPGRRKRRSLAAAPGSADIRGAIEMRAAEAARGAEASGALHPRRYAPWVFLAAFLLLTGLANGAYAASGESPSPAFQLITTLGSILLLWHWFSRQVAPYRPAWPIDMGVFIVAVRFFAMPYYLWRYERWRGMLKILALFGMYLCSWAVSLLVWLPLA